jgi:signal peptidase I
MAHNRADQEDVETTGRRAVIAFTLKVLLSAVVMAATTTLFSLFIWTVLPFAVGWSPSVIVTGSMEPSIAPGDIVVTAPIKPADLRLGYVIRFEDPSKAHPYLMHRITKNNDDGTLTTKGDANQSEDSTPVPRENVTGVARLRVPVIGLPAVWLRNGQYLQLGIALIAVAFAAQVLTGLRSLVASVPAGADDDPDPAESEPQLQDMDLPDLELGAPTDDTVDGTATVAVTSVVPAAATPSVEIAPPPVEAALPPAEAAPPPAEAAPPPAEAAPPPAEAAPPVEIAPGLPSEESAPAPALGSSHVPAGRHRGEGRASWRRNRNGDRPRSRRLDRTRTDDRVDSTAP